MNNILMFQPKAIQTEEALKAFVMKIDEVALKKVCEDYI
jgi:hypothetical protein